MAAGDRFYEVNPKGTVYLSHITPCVLYEASAQNLSGIDLWFMIFDVLVLPNPGDVPYYSFKVADQGTIAIAPPGLAGDPGRPFFLGLFPTWCATADYAQDAGPYGDSLIYIAGRDRA
jgi:hypothetical protein